ncbi:hypothetical protein ISN76_04840 [Dyella halodurans]|uniref:Uncharacterized protein n=1 Tax=Dyella halodurans TaxID=1920171 RepID=A0ABV9C158_9GAMM|nr:hypothetical protein [Dyella halodurans]
MVILLSIALIAAQQVAGSSGKTTSAIQCGEAKFTPETIICEHRDLQDFDASIAVSFEALKKTYNGEDLATFLQGQHFWLVERNDCRNGPTSDHYADGVYGCVREKLQSRDQVLRALVASPEKLQSTLADYSFVEPQYVHKHGALLVGKQVQVFGFLDLAACQSPETELRDGVITFKGASLPARLKSLPVEQVAYVCNKHPGSWWSGTIKAEEGGPYLYVTELLGVALP